MSAHSTADLCRPRLLLSHTLTHPPHLGRVVRWAPRGFGPLRCPSHALFIPRRKPKNTNMFFFFCDFRSHFQAKRSETSTNNNECLTPVVVAAWKVRRGSCLSLHYSSLLGRALKCLGFAPQRVRIDVPRICTSCSSRLPLAVSGVLRRDLVLRSFFADKNRRNFS